MVFISAGHNPNGVKPDPGAVGNGYKEADLAIDFRNLVCQCLTARGVKFITDKDTERLGEYLKRIQTGNGSVVVEYHFDAAESKDATGTTSLIGIDADRLDKAFATELVNTTSNCFGIKNRGVKSEAESHRGSLGLMREQGIVALVELGFISNVNDMKAYNFYKMKLAKIHAEIIERYEKLI